MAAEYSLSSVPSPVYWVVYGCGNADLSEAVNALIEHGWSVQGPVVAVARPDGCADLYQAMVR